MRPPAGWANTWVVTCGWCDSIRPDRDRPIRNGHGGAGFSAFSDGYPILVVARASLDELNSRLPAPLPSWSGSGRTSVLAGCAPFAEDSIASLASDTVRLRLVKPCSRCVITTVDQATGEPQGDEPLRTLKSYRWDADLRGVKFGQNAIVDGTGWLEAGALLTSD